MRILDQPPLSALRIREDFLGRPSTGRSFQLFTPVGAPKRVGAMAKLTALHLMDGKVQRFVKGSAWIGGVERGNWRRMVIGLEKPFAVPKGLDPDKTYDYGEVAMIEYEAWKPHLYGRNSPEYPFYHHFGDEGGPLPHLIFMSGALAFKGGGYGIEREGIRN